MACSLIVTNKDSLKVREFPAVSMHVYYYLLLLLLLLFKTHFEGWLAEFSSLSKPFINALSHLSHEINRFSLTHKRARKSKAPIKLYCPLLQHSTTRTLRFLFCQGRKGRTCL